MNSKSTDDRMAEIATGAVKEYVTTDKFRGKIEGKYYAEIKELVNRAEKRTTIATAIIGVLMLGVFTIACGREYLKVREKRIDIDEVYAEALSLINSLNEKIIKTNSDFESSINEITDRVEHFDVSTSNIEIMIKKLNADVELAKNEIDKLRQQKK